MYSKPTSSFDPKVVGSNPVRVPMDICGRSNKKIMCASTLKRWRRSALKINVNYYLYNCNGLASNSRAVETCAYRPSSKVNTVTVLNIRSNYFSWSTCFCWSVAGAQVVDILVGSSSSCWNKLWNPLVEPEILRT